MHGSYVVAAIGEGHVVRVAFTADVSDTLTNWRRRHGAMMPVVIERADLDQPVVAEVLDVLAPSAPVAIAAKMLHDFEIASEAYRIVLNSIRQLGELGVSLLSEWTNAVAESRGVLAT